MSISFLTGALLAISLLTNVTVEAIKKIMDGIGKMYSSTLMAVIVSVVITCALSVGYLILNGIAFDLEVGVQIIALIYMSFLTATLGYDKIVDIFTKLTTTK